MPALQGQHQLDNAAGAIMLVRGLQAQLPVDWPAIQRALPRLHLPGRMERRGRFLLDVAHNAEAAAMLARSLREQFGPRRVLWIAGVLSDKPIEAIGHSLAAHVDVAITCTLPSPRALSAEALATRLGNCGIAAQAAGSPTEALALALRQAPADQPILVCGSFLTVAAIAPLIAP